MNADFENDGMTAPDAERRLNAGLTGFGRENQIGREFRRAVTRGIGEWRDRLKAAIGNRTVKMRLEKGAPFKSCGAEAMAPSHAIKPARRRTPGAIPPAASGA
jgi:hypothetical protein